MTAPEQTAAALFIPAWLQGVLWASVYGTALAAAVLLAQPLLRRCRVPARWRFALWLLVLVRFTPLPLPESRWSVWNYLPTAPPPAAARPADRLPEATPLVAAESPRPARSVVTGDAAAASAPGAAPAAASFAAPPTIAPPPALTAVTIPPAIVPAPPSSPPAATPWPQLLVAAYAAGVTAVLLRLALATARLRGIVRHARPVHAGHALLALSVACKRLGVRPPPPLLAAAGLPGPALVGLWRPRLLLPHGLADVLSEAELRHVFLHELAHLRRRDVAANYWMALVAAAHWFNPALWLLLPRMRAERELACDELVLAHTPDPAAYGHTLLTLAELQTAPGRPLAPAVGVVDGRSFFTRRIVMIARFQKTPGWWLLPAGAAGLLIAATTCTSAVSSPPLQAAASETQPTTEAMVRAEQEWLDSRLRQAAAANAATDLSSKLTDLRVRLAVEEPTYGPNFAHVMNLRRTIKAMEAELAKVSAAATSPPPATRPEVAAADNKAALGAGRDAAVKQALAPEVARIKIELADVRQQLVDAQSKFGPGHSVVQNLRSRIASLEAMQSALEKGDETAYKGAAAPRGQAESPKPARQDPDDAISAKLDATLPGLTADGQPLEKVLRFMQDQLRANVFINWRALETVGIDRAAPVTLDLHDVTHRRAIQMILDQVSAGTGSLGFVVEDGVITISTRDDLAGQAHLATRVYNVRDLLISNERAAAADPQSLIDLIVATASPDTWRNNGGTVSSISEFKGLLTVTSTPAVHQQVTDLLASLRTADREHADLPAYVPKKTTTAPSSPEDVRPPATAPAVTPGK
jgi:beta-lactamase regulating signal transducer with metallopeptidase domain